MKKVSLYFFSGILLVSVFIFYIYSIDTDYAYINHSDDLSVFLETGNNTDVYEKVSLEKWPEGYILNKDKSYCTYGSLLEWKDASLLVASAGEDKCYIYLDNYIFDYDYTGAYQKFTAPLDGVYQFELWGASGTDNYKYSGGYGAYTSAHLNLIKGTVLYLYVGSTGLSDSDIGGYNGGGNISARELGFGSTGGGATDLRIHSGIWSDAISLNSRIMVSSGGGGANKRGDLLGEGPGASGGGLIGYSGVVYNYNSSSGWGNSSSSGGSQIQGGVYIRPSISAADLGENVISATFGMSLSNLYITQTGGGGGYYGGASSAHIGGGGGSSFISGHTGAVAITSENDRTPLIGCFTGTTDNSCSHHYSGYVFNNTVMIDGNGYSWTNNIDKLEQMPKPDGTFYSIGEGHVGNGYAQVTYKS